MNQLFRGKVLSPRSMGLAATLLMAASGAQATELFFDFNHNLNPPNASVFLFGNSGQEVTVSNNAGFNQTFNLNTDGFYNLFIDSSYQQSGTGITNKGFKVVSPDALAGYFINRASATTDMTYLLDSTSLGTNYVVASQGNGFGEGSQVMIHATQNNTKVEFKPVGSSTVSVTLNAGETYKYAGGGTNLTGSFVSSDKPVAVFGGHECAQVPSGTVACDNLIEQMIPTDKLSNSYTVTASLGAENSAAKSDLVRVIATADNTEVKVGGVVVATLSAGQYHEFSLAEKSGTKIDASSPVMVAQYLKGTGYGGNNNATDPAMALVPGSDTWLSKYYLSTPTGSQDFSIDYASIVIKMTDLPTLMLDGTVVDPSNFSAIAGTDFYRGILGLPNGLFKLTAANPFLVMLGGGDYYDSYLTYGGSTFSPGISPPPPPSEIPEPTTMVLFATGLTLLSRLRTRKK